MISSAEPLEKAEAAATGPGHAALRKDAEDIFDSNPQNNEVFFDFILDSLRRSLAEDDFLCRSY